MIGSVVSKLCVVTSQPQFVIDYYIQYDIMVAQLKPVSFGCNFIPKHWQSLTDWAAAASIMYCRFQTQPVCGTHLTIMQVFFYPVLLLTVGALVQQLLSKSASKLTQLSVYLKDPFFFVAVFISHTSLNHSLTNVRTSISRCFCDVYD